MQGSHTSDSLIGGEWRFTTRQLIQLLQPVVPRAKSIGELGDGPLVAHQRHDIFGDHSWTHS